jgi:hypothetical protein
MESRNSLNEERRNQEAHGAYYLTSSQSHTKSAKSETHRISSVTTIEVEFLNRKINKK